VHRRGAKEADQRDRREHGHRRDQSGTRSGRLFVAPAGHVPSAARWAEHPRRTPLGMGVHGGALSSGRMSDSHGNASLIVVTSPGLAGVCFSLTGGARTRCWRRSRRGRSVEPQSVGAAGELFGRRPSLKCPPVARTRRGKARFAYGCGACCRRSRRGSTECRPDRMIMAGAYLAPGAVGRCRFRPLFSSFLSRGLGSCPVSHRFFARALSLPFRFPLGSGFRRSSSRVPACRPSTTVGMPSRGFALVPGLSISTINLRPQRSRADFNSSPGSLIHGSPSAS